MPFLVPEKLFCALACILFLITIAYKCFYIMTLNVVFVYFIVFFPTSHIYLKHNTNWLFTCDISVI